MAWKKTGEIENQLKNQGHSDYSIFVISQNIEKSPENLRRLAVTWTPMKDHQLMLMKKTPNQHNDNNNNNNNN